MAGVVPLSCRPLSAIRQAARPPLLRPQIRPASAAFPRHLSSTNTSLRCCRSPLASKASVRTPENTVEPGTNVDFPWELKVPGCSDSLVLLGTGYREKVFSIIGVKVYAAGLYVKRSIIEIVDAWKGKSVTDIGGDSALFDAIFKAPMEKSLRIELVRDVDGKTFWNALDEAISPRIKEPTPTDESALSTFRNTFQGRDLKRGAFIYLTWVRPSEMLVSISSDGLPSSVDAQLESPNVTLALYDAFLGNSPVSPTLKASVADGLTVMLN